MENETEKNINYEAMYLAEKKERIKYEAAHQQLQNEFEVFRSKRDETVNNAVTTATTKMSEALKAAKLDYLITKTYADSRKDFVKHPGELATVLKEQIQKLNFDDGGTFTDDKGRPSKARIVGKEVGSIADAYIHLYDVLKFGVADNQVKGEKYDSTGVKALESFFTEKGMF